MLNKLKLEWKHAIAWFNAIMLAALPVFEYLRDSLPDYSALLGVDVYRYMGAVVVVVNLLLHFKAKNAASA